jgi:hypothetical protein
MKVNIAVLSTIFLITVFPMNSASQTDTSIMTDEIYIGEKNTDTSKNDTVSGKDSAANQLQPESTHATEHTDKQPSGTDKPGSLPYRPEPYSPFFFDKAISIGLGLSGFYYRENFPMSDEIKYFEDIYGYPPSVIIGEPKSTEYGLLPSIDFSFTKVVPQKRFFFNPSFDLFIGYKNQYDGSSQSVDISDSDGFSVGWKYYPYKEKKNNIFFHTSVLCGFFRESKAAGAACYSGFNAKIWYRSFVPAKIELDETDGYLYSSETYSSYSIPFGLTYYHRIKNMTTAGITAEIDMMFYGLMQVNESVYDENDEAVSNIDFDYPDVKLGNKAQYKIEAFVMHRLSRKMFIRMSIYGMAYSFGQSNTGTATETYNGNEYSMHFFEPASSTICGGIKADIGFSFTPSDMKY